MNNNSWFKKERPLLSLTGFGGGSVGPLMGAAGDPNVEASGGMIGEYTDPTGDNIYRTHTFVSPGFLQVSQVVGDGEIEYLVVAGGGGGGMTSHNYSYPHGIEETSGGGGGGGVRTNLPGLPTSASNPLKVSTSGGPTSNGKYPITIGRGAPVGSTNAGNGFQGLDSTFNFSPTAYITSGGGGGGSGENSFPQRRTGGSGGGGNIEQPTVSPTPQTTLPGGEGNDPPTSPAQGFDGGDASAQSRGGGGGGAIEVGAPGATTGKGGDGLGTTIENGNITVYYGGGGGGGGQYAPPINGGAAGPLDPTVPTTGYYPSIPGKGTGTGGRGNIPWGGSYPGMMRYQYQTSGAGGISGYGQGGGGASVFGSGAPGGDGCVVIRYKIAEQTGTAKATGGIINYYPESPLSPTGAVIHIFRGPGRFNTPPTFSPTETLEYVAVGGGGAGGCRAAAGGGGAGGYVTGTTTIPAGSAFINIFVGMGGNGRDPGYNWGGAEVIGTDFVSAGQGYGGNTVVQFPTGTVTAGGGAYGIGKFRTPTAIDPSPPTSVPSEGYAGNVPLGSGGGGGSSPARPPGTGGPQGNDGGGNTHQIGGGGGGAGGVGGDGVGTPTLYRGGYGGAGVQLPATFRNPTMLTPASETHTGGGLGYPGPGGGGFWVAGGGGGGTTVGSWGDDGPTGGAYGVYGGGPGASSVTGKVQWGPSHYWFGWCGAGSGRGVGTVGALPNGTYGPTAPGTNRPATSGYGGSAAANSGSGGGGGAQEPKFAPPPGVPMTGSFPSGGNGGPGLVLIAYPQ